MSTWIRQFTCGLGGHDELLQFEAKRLSLVCVSCGHESPGWDVSGPQPVVTTRRDGVTRRLAGPRLGETRRAA